MSLQRFRHFALVLISGSVLLAPVMSVQASSPARAAPTSLETSTLASTSSRREIAPPVMQQVAHFEASAPQQVFKAPPAKLSRPLLQAPSNPRLFREVFGFAFASSLGDPTIGYPSWNFGLLSTVAYFGLHVSWTGEFSDDSALTTWNNPSGPTPAFISAAHAQGTKVVVTIIMFDSTSGTPNMCSALIRSQVTIRNTVSQVVSKGIDGVNVDYESNNAQCTDPSTGVITWSQTLFTGFVRDLRAALPSGSYLSVDSYSGSAGYRSGTAFYGFYDIGALGNYVDSFFVMAYDMEYANAGSAPLNCSSFCLGPTAPLTTYDFNDTRASSEYRAVVPASKVLMGIPYYGRKECVSGVTPSSAPPNAYPYGNTVAADGYLDASTEQGYFANTDYQTHREVHDTQGNTRWDTFTSSTAGCTREMYWDDVTALGNKYDLIINDHLRGAGIFALNYGGGAPELWSLINLKFGQCSNATIAADHSSPQIPGTAVTFAGTAFCAGTATYRFWAQSPNSVMWSMAQDYGTTASTVWDTTGKALGTYRFEVDARNQGSSVSYDTAASMPFRLALCVTPTLTPDRAPPQLPGTIINFTATVTCQGTPEYRFWVQPPGGAWAIGRDYGPSGAFRWDTTGKGLGNYSVEVDTRVSGTSIGYESVLSMPFALTSCITQSLTTDKTSPQPTGAQILLTGSATCSGTPQYRFSVQPPGGSWAVAQDFGASSTFNWNAGGSAGTYGLELDAKSATAPVSSMVHSELTFDLTSCSASVLSTDLASPQVPGTPITLTGTATCQGTPQYRFWVQKPGSAWVIARDYASLNKFKWTTAGLPNGDYGLEVDVRHVGALDSYETAASQRYTLAAQPCTKPTLSPGVPSPQGTGAGIAFTSSTSVCPQPVFKFWIQPPSGSWGVAQDYSSASTFTWPATGPDGTYGVEVDVRDASRPLTYDAVTNLTYVLTACSGATLTTDLPSQQPPGAVVTITGTATCPRTPDFRFWIQPPGGSWSSVQGYGASSTYKWNTAGLATGTYGLEVDVRDHGAAATWESVASGTFMLTPPCAKPTLSAGASPPHPTGAPLSFTASTGACPIPEYRFWLLAPGGGWTIAQDYGPTAIFAWGGSSQPGNYGVEVDVRGKGSSASYDAVTNLSFTLGACTSAALAADHSSPQAVGTPVVLTASSSCAGTPQYRFWMQPPNGSWTTTQVYGSGATYSWNTTGLPIGTYQLEVDVRNQGSTVSYEAVGRSSFTLTSPPCASPALVPSVAPSQGTGVSVTLTGSATGCPVPEYRFWVQSPGGAWTVARDYATSPTFVWNGPTGGIYGLEVDVRALGSTVSYEVHANIAYTRVACAAAGISADHSSPQAHGTTVIFTGAAACMGTPEYRFWIQTPDGKWRIARDYGASATFSWDTSGLAAGDYQVEVDVRDQGASSTYETVAHMPFRLT